MGKNKVGRPKKLNNDIIDYKILDLLEQGLNYKQIEVELGLSDRVISYRVRAMRERGIEIPDIIKTGRPRRIINDEKDNKILELLEKGLTQAQIANKLHISKQAVSKKIKNMKERGIEIPEKKKAVILQKEIKNYELDTKIVELLEKGLNKKEIVNILNVSYYSVSNRIKILEKQGIKSTKNIKRGRPKKTSNDEKDNKIIELLEQGLTQTQIADILGITQVSISKRISSMKNRNIDISHKINNNSKKIENNEIKDIPKEKIEIKEMNIANRIVNLMNTKNANVEQVRAMAKLYQVDEEVEKILKSLDDKER